MSSLVKTLRRCHSTVRADRKSWAAISGLDRPELGGGAPDQARGAHWLGRRDQEYEPGRFRQRLHPPQEALFYPARQRSLIRQAEAARQLHCAQPTWQLEQGSGFPLVSARIRS